MSSGLACQLMRRHGLRQACTLTNSTTFIPTTNTFFTQQHLRSFSAEPKSKLTLWEKLFGEYVEHYGEGGDPLRDQIIASKQKVRQAIKEQMNSSKQPEINEPRDHERMNVRPGISLFGQQIKREETVKEEKEDVPKEPQDQPEIAAFFRVFCPSLNEHNEKFLTWESLITSNSRSLRTAGLNIKHRKLLLKALERYKARQRRKEIRDLLFQLPDEALQTPNENIQRSIFSSLYAHVYARQFRRAHNMEITYWWRRSLEMQFIRRKWVRNEFNGLDDDDSPYTAKHFRDPKKALLAIEAAIEDMRERVRQDDEEGTHFSEHLQEMEMNAQYKLAHFDRKDITFEDSLTDPFMPDFMKPAKDTIRRAVQTMKYDTERATNPQSHPLAELPPLTAQEIADAMSPWKRTVEPIDRSRVFVEKVRPYPGASLFPTEDMKNRFNALDRRLFGMKLSERARFSKTQEFAKLKEEQANVLEDVYEQSRNKHINLWDSKVKLWKNQLEEARSWYSELKFELQKLESRKDRDSKSETRLSTFRGLLDRIKKDYEVIAKRLENRPNFESMSNLELERRDQYIWKQRLLKEFENVEFDETDDQALPNLSQISDVDKLNIMSPDEIFDTKKSELRQEAVEGIIDVITKRFAIDDIDKNQTDFMPALVRRVRKISKKLSAFRPSSEYDKNLWKLQLMAEALERKVKNPNSTVMVPSSVLQYFQLDSRKSWDRLENYKSNPDPEPTNVEDMRAQLTAETLGLSLKEAEKLFKAHPDITFDEFEAASKYEGPVLNESQQSRLRQMPEEMDFLAEAELDRDEDDLSEGTRNKIEDSDDAISEDDGNEEYDIDEDTSEKK